VNKPLLWVAVILGFLSAARSDDRLVGHWPLAGDTRDHSGNDLHAENRGARLTADGPSEAALRSAAFNGRDAFLQVPGVGGRIGEQSFTISLWARLDPSGSDVPGSLLSLFDPITRRGFHLSVKTNAGVTFNLANDRQLQFGLADGSVSPWIDCGRPGTTSILAFAMAVHDGQLYAGTCEPGPGDSGRVYRYRGGQDWEDCGSPWGSNAVTALASFDGKLYAGVGKYRLAGSALAESENPTLGGRVFSYEGEKTWRDCGQLAGVEAVSGLALFGGRLYAGSLYRPAGFFRYEGGEEWTACETPGEKRVEALCVFNGHLYATGYDEGHVYRFDGRSWTDCGGLADNTQTYGFAVYWGRLYVGSWPSGRVYRFEDVGEWTDVGRLGEELEVMGMAVHNGSLLAGTLPLAQVYRFEREGEWRLLTQLDTTPDVRYRRAWTMAEYQGRLFTSTLPSGRVHSLQVGRTAAWERVFPEGWHHVAASRWADGLSVYVDGRREAHMSELGAAPAFALPDQPLLIGFGPQDYFHGRMRDVRVYRGALSAEEIRLLAEGR
jgi:hypothetical protein